MAAEAAGLRKASDTKQIDVTKEDQLMINSFNRANNRKHELLELIKKQKVTVLLHVPSPPSTIRTCSDGFRYLAAPYPNEECCIQHLNPIARRP